MRFVPRRRPSAALAIACIALGVALGGTSYATVLQVPRNSVGAPQLRDGAVTTPKLRANAVTSAKVRNRSLLRADFAAGQLPAGPPGPAGPAGPPGMSATERVDATSVLNSAAFKSAFLACPAGKRLIGGGARIDGPNNLPVALVESYPDDDNIWRAHARETALTNTAWSVTVFAICAVVT